MHGCTCKHGDKFCGIMSSLIGFFFCIFLSLQNFAKTVFGVSRFRVRPDFLYSLVYHNFFQRSNVGGQNKNRNKMSQNKDIT